jgi:hypothetical protein
MSKVEILGKKPKIHTENKSYTSNLLEQIQRQPKGQMDRGNSRTKPKDPFKQHNKNIQKKASALAKEKDLFHWLNTQKNPEYEEGLKRLSFEPCLIHNKGNKKNAENGEILVQTKPKYLTQLLREKYNKKTGNWDDGMEILETNSFKQANHRKIKALNKFCNKYQPLYQKKEVSLFILTFTRMNKARLSIKTMMKIVTEYFKRLGYPVRAFIWTLEVSANLHAHYHVGIAVDRMNLKKIPKQMKFNGIWGQRTEIDFIKKNVKHYLAKYFAKHNSRLEGYRSYGMSKNLK